MKNVKTHGKTHGKTCEKIRKKTRGKTREKHKNARENPRKKLVKKYVKKREEKPVKKHAFFARTSRASFKKGINYLANWSKLWHLIGRRRATCSVDTQKTFETL